jgi:O-antigen/teichoic acid export membrane protein
MALGRPWVRVGFEIVGVLVLVVASVLLTTGLGVIGMFLALACSEWSMTAIGFALIWTTWRNTKRRRDLLSS